MKKIRGFGVLFSFLSFLLMPDFYDNKSSNGKIKVITICWLVDARENLFVYGLQELNIPLVPSLRAFMDIGMKEGLKNMGMGWSVVPESR